MPFRSAPSVFFGLFDSADLSVVLSASFEPTDLSAGLSASFDPPVLSAGLSAFCDPSGFSAFHSYASLWIQQGIQRDCNPVWIDYYFPAHYKERMFRSLQKYYRESIIADNLSGVQLCGMIVTIFVKCAAISKASPVHSAHIVFHRRRELY